MHTMSYLMLDRQAGTEIASAEKRVIHTIENISRLHDEALRAPQVARQ